MLIKIPSRKFYNILKLLNSLMFWKFSIISITTLIIQVHYLIHLTNFQVLYHAWHTCRMLGFIVTAESISIRCPKLKVAHFSIDKQSELTAIFPQRHFPSHSESRKEKQHLIALYSNRDILHLENNNRNWYLCCQYHTFEEVQPQKVA